MLHDIADLRAALLWSWRLLGPDWRPMPELMPPVPIEWRDILSVVCAFSRDTEDTAFIAGGSLRDTILGQPPKDIDIFVGPRWCGENILSKFGEVSVIKDDDSPVESDAKSYDDSITKIVNLNSTTRQLYQIIERPILPNAMNLIGAFDFGICSCAWSPKGWVVHPNFMQDLSERIFRARNVGYETRTKRRAEIFAARYPGWNVDLSIFDQGLF